MSGTAEFTITPDVGRGVLYVQMAGFFLVADVHRYHAALARASEQLACAMHDQCVVCDITGMRIQTQDVVDAFATVMADSRYAGRRVAMIVSPSLARAQAQRAATAAAREPRFFADRAAADAWIGDRRAAAA